MIAKRQLNVRVPLLLLEKCEKRMALEAYDWPGLIQNLLRRYANGVGRPRAGKDGKGDKGFSSSSLFNNKSNTEEKKTPVSAKAKATDVRHGPMRSLILNLWLKRNPGTPAAPWGPAEGKNLAVFLKENPSWTWTQIHRCLVHRFQSEVNHSEPPRMWLRDLARYAGGPLDRFGKPMGKELNRAEERDRRNAEKIARVFGGGMATNSGGQLQS